MTEEEFQQLENLLNELKENQLKNGESLSNDIKPIKEYIEKSEKIRTDEEAFRQSDEYKTQVAADEKAQQEADESLQKSYKHLEEIAASMKAMEKISEENQKNALTDSETTLSSMEELRSDLADYQKQTMESDTLIAGTLVISAVLMLGLHGFLGRIFSR